MSPAAVVGCGGTGCSIVSSMVPDPDIRKITVNVGSCGQDVTIPTPGLKGCRGDPDLGWALTSENVPKIRESLSGCSAVVAVAGLGGGFGSGAISVVTECARNLGVKAVSAVCIPMSFEAERRARALAQLEDVINGSDRTIVIDLDHLGNVSGPETPFKDLVSAVDRLMNEAVLRIVQMTKGPFLSLFTAKSYTAAYSSSPDYVGALSSVLESGLYDTDPAGGKIIISTDSKLDSGEELRIRGALCNKTGIMPEIVAKKGGSGQGMLLFIPMIYHI